MTNPHFANLGDVWKHLLLAEVASRLRPECYVETHAGSASYRLTGDAERGLGAGMFLSASSAAEPLRDSPYRRHVLELARGAEPSYPGSPLLAMMLLDSSCRYVFCDTDPASVADLRAARERLGLQDKAEVIHGDGLAHAAALLRAGALSAASLVHVDPFDLPAPGPGGLSALDLVTRLAAAGVPVFAWYGLTARPPAREMFGEVAATAPAVRAWRAELRVSGPRASAGGIGRGCGVLFAAPDLAPAGSMQRVAGAFARAFNEHSAAVGAGVSVTASFAASAPGPSARS
ncbi:MAG TPA: 23S rRNA (adenine(2030)-N(6))-methyltransferase RlmJ [Streptosporangiaceae bacterium]|jgi:23S rRNA A2030 N6-methylase RlmJ